MRSSRQQRDRPGLQARSSSAAICRAIRSAKQRRHCVAELKLLLSSVATNHEVIGERHEPLQLGHTKAPVLPMERPDPRSRLALDRRGRPIGMQLQEEAPVAAAPLELRVRMSALLREVEVVLARRNLAKRIGVGAVNDLLGLRRIVEVAEPASASPAVTWEAEDSSLSTRRSCGPSCVSAGQSKRHRSGAQSRRSARTPITNNRWRSCGTPWSAARITRLSWAYPACVTPSRKRSRIGRL